jgi:hypothetical protein
MFSIRMTAMYVKAKPEETGAHNVRRDVLSSGLPGRWMSAIGQERTTPDFGRVRFVR